MTTRIRRNRALRRLSAALQAILPAVCVAAAGCQAPPRAASTAPASAPTTTQWSLRGWSGTQIRTEHWVVNTTTTDPHWMDDLPQFVEAAYGQYQTLVPAPRTSRALTLYLFDNAVQWEDYVDPLGIGRSDVDLLAQVSGISHKDVTAAYVGAEPTETLSSIAHAGMHQYLWLHDAGDAPLWVREGLATLCEGFDQRKDRFMFEPRFNGKRWHQARLAILNRSLFDLETLLDLEGFEKSGEPYMAARIYLAELWGLMVFLEDSRQYQKGTQQMRTDLADGTFRLKVRGYIAASSGPMSPGQAAFRLYITEDLDKFEREFRDWLPGYVALRNF